MGRISNGYSFAGSSGGAAPLLQDLVAYWNLNETSGNRADSGPNGYTLTDNNTVGNAAGVGAGQTAANFEAASLEYLSRTVTAPLILTPPFEVAMWVYLPALPGDGRAIAYQRDSSASFPNGWQVSSAATSGRLTLRVRTSGGIITTPSNGFIQPTAETWHFVTLGHDGTNAFLRLDENAEQTVSAPNYLPSVADEQVAFARTAASTPAYIDIREQAIGFWGRRLTADERTFLYNSGTAARLHADLSSFTG